ncbi:MAG: acetylxylan esterase [Candidatus Poribacteria bacterium]|nr:acetylxylan esterase [Candidatus Poribacteria bacterium]
MFGQEIVEFYHQTVQASLRQSPFDTSSKAAFAAWQVESRERLSAILGEMPAETVDFNLQRETVEETDTYVRERLVYATRPGLHATAYLLTPKNLSKPAPAVLALHGHSSGGKDECLDPNGLYAGFARTFAEQGCVVLAPDQIGFGERKFPEGKVTYNVMVHGLNMLGHTLIGVRYWDLARALDLLETFDTVKADRIGVMGLSLGGEMTMFVAALQERVHAACVSCYLTSHQSTFLDRPHCTCGHLRDLARHFEHVDISAMIAPRPLFLEAGRKDDSFPYEDAEALARDLRPIYAMHGNDPSDIGVHSHGGGHVIDGSQSIPWMLERLNQA